MSFKIGLLSVCKFIFSLVLISFFACGSQSNTVTIEGTINGSNSKYVIVRDASHNVISTIDSTRTNNLGFFEVGFEITTTQFVLLQVEDEREPIILLVEPNEKIVISGISGDLSRNYSVRGSNGSQLVRELNRKLNDVVSSIDSLSLHFRNSRENPQFDSIKLAIDTAYLKLLENHKNYTIDFIKSNRYSLASILALYQQYNQTTPVLNSRDDFELFRLVDSVLYPLHPNNTLVANLHNNVNKISAQLRIYDKRESMLTEGQKLPNIELPLFKDDTIKLYDVKSRFILVDFWASWCNECIPNNKKLKGLYNDFSSKGFQIVQVSLDENPNALAKALEIDSIPWIVVADFKQWNSPIVDTLSVNSIPSNYLINSQGIIQARNLTLNELESVLKSLLP